MANIFRRQAMFEQSSDITAPSFFKRQSIAAVRLWASLLAMSPSKHRQPVIRINSH
jgi:hypothetical protein